MTLFAFIAIVVFGIFCAALKWSRTSRLAFLLSTVLFLALGCGPIPAWLLNNLQSDYAVRHPIEWGKRNAIVLLGAGTQKITDVVEPGTFSYARIVETAGLYNDCRKTLAECKIIVSGGDATRTGSPESAVYRGTLLRLGVDIADVLLESDSMNTFQNAQFTSAILRRYDADRVALVSSGFHLKRSELYFAHFGVSATPVRADYLRAQWSIIPTSYNLLIADVASQEYIGIARYHAYNLLGWNAKVTRASEG